MEERAIEQTLIRYALACDRRDWLLMEQVFLSDVVANYGGEYRIKGRDKVVGMVRSLLGGCGPTQHLLGNFRIFVDGDSATCECYVRAAHAGCGEQSSLTYEVWAEYRDTLHRTEEGWRILERKMVVFHESGSRNILKPD